MQEDSSNNNAAASPVKVWDGWAQGSEPRGVEAGVAQPLEGGFARKTGATLTLCAIPYSRLTDLRATLFGACKAFYRSAAFLLLATGVIKLAALFLNSTFLSLQDPLFRWFTHRDVLAMAVLLELIVGITLWKSRNTREQWFLVAWVTAIFSAYRMGLWLVGYHGPCPCLGMAIDWLTGSTLVENWIATSIFLYLLSGCVIAAFIQIFYCPVPTAH